MNRVLRDLLAMLYRATGLSLVGAIALAVIYSLTEGIGIMLLIPTLQIAGLNLMGQGRLQTYSRYIYAAFGWIHLTPTLPVLLIFFLILISARTFMMKLESVLASSIQERIEAELRGQLHQAIVDADWLFLFRKKSSDLVHILTSEVERVGAATSFTLTLAGDLLVTTIYVIVATALSAGVTAMVLGSGLLLALVLRNRTRALETIGAKTSNAGQLLYGAIISHVQNLKATKAYNAEAHDRDVFAALNSAVAEVRNEAVRKHAFSSGWFEIGSFLILIAGIYISIRLFAVGPASILILLLIFSRLMPRVVATYSHYQSIVNQLPAFSAISAMQKECAEASEKLDVDAPRLTLSRGIELKNICFTYQPAAGAVIKNASLAIPVGKTVALVGPSGSGKSTLADLAIGLLRPDTGTVSIDGLELTKSNLAGWRSQIGYVSQDTVLFHDTVRANLSWARRDIDEAQMWEALKLAAAEELVRRLPDGLDTIVGDRGAFLSQGERQRLAIARALLRHPAMLVLDEATNSLDVDNEARVLEAIDNLHGDLTILIIAHRFSTLKRADLVYVVERGEILESGSWQTLANRHHRLIQFPELDEVREGALTSVRV